MSTNNTNQELTQILHMLHEKTGVDFSDYKSTTMTRRIQRRIALKNIDNLKSYVIYLRKNPAEIIALQKDMLIHVTRFFREPEKFTALKKVIFPLLLKKRSPKNPIRIWVPGCSTGEEAYSLAITFMEFLGDKAEQIPLQIFATDLSETAIEKARTGVYPASITEHMKPAQLRRFFTPLGDNYQVKKEIRDVCVFAVHDLTQNPPFSNIDLVSCLNVLIYLGPNLQKKVLMMFHYALRPEGYLMLGKAENSNMNAKLFQSMDREQKIYIKNDESTSELPKLQTLIKLPKNTREINHQIDRSSHEQKILKLREGLELTREYADSIINELDVLTEELQSSNEELLANNEELQTANEELETSQEELQAANDELRYREELLRESEERFRLLIQNSADIISIFSADGKILYQSQSVENVLGHKPQDRIGKTIQNDPITHPDDVHTKANMIKEAINRPNDTIKAEFRLKHKDGSWHYIEALAINRITDPGIYGIITNYRDITERKRVEDTLLFLNDASKILASSLDYKTTLANTAKLAVPSFADWCSITMVDEDGTQKELAVAHKDTKKVKWAKELSKRYPPDLDAPHGVPNVIRTGKTEFATEIPDNLLVASAKDDEMLRILRNLGLKSFMTVPIKRQNRILGAITFVDAESGRRYTHLDVAIAEEIAHRAALSIENAKLYSDAQKAISIRDDFISIASHELKTPVTSLKIYAQVLQKQLKEKGELAFSDQLAKMDKQLDSLTKLVRDLLDVSSLEHGKLEYNEEAFDLQDLVHETIANIQPTTKKHTIVLQGKLNKKVTADRFRINQVLVNLLTNAIKYSPTKSQIIIQLTEEKNMAIVQVQDFGIGIDQKYQSSIFKRFYRVEDSTENTYPGLGMGLYISYQIIKRHGGDMTVVSKKNKGSLFSFTLPLSSRNPKIASHSLKGAGEKDA